MVGMVVETATHFDINDGDIVIIAQIPLTSTHLDEL